ncbi:glycine/betaine ABC transporter [Dietzia sp. UCD-THP]|uniref:BCCT family transporter n=1 Tax=Dietzia sp. UCD-THP TaxID=1292020 RepID=UPI00037487FA|nr:BCCT family transporter [Dietzia sp. UCD-THP]EYT64887.1 glycine/betaine ABC transporter [Dietzia sp. UCD-THP]
MSSSSQQKSDPASTPAAKPRADLAVIIPTTVIALIVVVWGAFYTASFENAAGNAFSLVVETVGWLFILVSTTVVAYTIYLAFSRFGGIRLGGDNEKPEYSTKSWIAMMFAAGMGIGLMFYGVSEPLTHYQTPPPGQEQQYDVAMATTAFHWTLHPWAMYAVVGLALGLAAYRFKRGHLVSQAFVPLIGQKRASGWIGKVLDVATVVATIFGTAASLGLGALQIRAGLNETGAVDGGGIALVVGVIVVLGLVFLASAASGIGNGIRILSNINLVLAVSLALFVAVFSGALFFMLDLIPTTIGTYFSDFFEMASRTAVSENGEAAGWLSSWTVFYWAWWISWSPFVGMFLARISRGRTVREFIIGVVLVPSTLSVIWFSIFGGFALYLEEAGRSVFGDGSLEPQLFNLLRELPLAGVLMVMAMLLIAVFFITSADSASIVMGGMAQYGIEEPSRWIVMLMGSFTAAVAIIMLVAGDGGGNALSSLQNMTIIAASPFVLVLIALCVSIHKSLSHDPAAENA